MRLKLRARSAHATRTRKETTVNTSTRNGSTRTIGRPAPGSPSPTRPFPKAMHVGLLAGLLAGLLIGPGAASAEPGALSQSLGNEGCISQGGNWMCNDSNALHGSFGVAVNKDGKHAYVASVDSNTLAILTRDKTTGALTQLPDPLGCISEDGSGGLCADGKGLTNPIAVAVSPDGRNVYVASFQRDPVLASALAVFAQDKTTGGLVQLPDKQGCISDDGTGGTCTDGVALRGTTDVAVSNDGKHVYVTSAPSSAVAIFTRDKTTGALTQLPGQQGCVSEDGTGGLCTDGRALLGASGSGRQQGRQARLRDGATRPGGGGVRARQDDGRVDPAPRGAGLHRRRGRGRSLRRWPRAP